MLRPLLSLSCCFVLGGQRRPNCRPSRTPARPAGPPHPGTSALLLPVCCFCLPLALGATAAGVGGGHGL